MQTGFCSSPAGQTVEQASRIKIFRLMDTGIYSDTQKFVQNIDQHLLKSITNSQKNNVFHEGFDSIIRFLNASTFYGLLTPCTNFGVWL